MHELSCLESETTEPFLSILNIIMGKVENVSLDQLRSELLVDCLSKNTL
jgi:hypothetical protein